MTDAPEAPAPEQDQPITPEAPETQDQPTGEDSFTESYNPSELPDDVRPHVEAAYKQLQSDYTSKTQSLAEERREAEQAQAIVEGLQNPELMPHYLKLLGHDPNDPEFLGKLGFELADQEVEDDDFLESGDPRVDQVIEYLQNQEQQRAQDQQMAAAEEYIAEQLEALEGDQKFSQKEIKAIRTNAEAVQDARGLPDVKGAVELQREIQAEDRQRWIDSKKTGRPPGPGTDAKRQVDFANIDDPAERKRAQHAAVIQAAEEAQASQE